MSERCSVCKAGELQAATVERRREFGGRVYRGQVEGWRCDQCDAVLIDDEALEGFDVALGQALAQGEPNGKAFAFIRKQLDLRGVDVAALLNVSMETVSRWETEARPVDWMAFALVGQMLLERHKGLSTTRDHLTALKAARGQAVGDVDLAFTGLCHIG